MFQYYRIIFVFLSGYSATKFSGFYTCNATASQKPQCDCGMKNTVIINKNEFLINIPFKCLAHCFFFLINYDLFLFIRYQF